MSRVTLVVPAYNESGNIELFFKSCTEAQKGSSHIFDYVFIDDGSSDGTFDVVKRLSERNPNSGIKGIRFSRNFGKEAGILAGLRNSTGEYTVVVDADLQQNPKYIIEMADFLDNNPNYDCVACYQKDRKENGLMKFMKKSFYKIMDNSSDTNFVEDASDFRMMRREMVDAVLQLGEYHRFSKGIFSWVGFTTYYMPYEVEERHSGDTSWNFKSLTKYALEGIFGFSPKPLRISTWIGAITSVLALVFLLYIVLKTAIVGKDVPGYATIVCLILIVGGVQMVLLGIMGEYISRIFVETKHRPIYIVKECVDSSGNQGANADEAYSARHGANSYNFYREENVGFGAHVDKENTGDHVYNTAKRDEKEETELFKWEKI